MRPPISLPRRAPDRARPGLFWLLLALVLVPAAVAQSPLGELGLAALERQDAGPALPPWPSPAPAPVQLVLDDGSAESLFGFSGSNARPFLWMNQFANPGPFQIEEIRVLFPSGGGVPAGGDIQLLVYLDPNGDPTDGAELIYSSNRVVAAIDGTTFSVYPVTPPLEILGPGDVLIGVINRYFQTGVDPPPTFPAALDVTFGQGRSWVALWTGDAGDPPLLPPDLSTERLDGATAGNFMIRGLGSPVTISDIPALGPVGSIVWVAAIAILAIGLLRRLA